MSKLDVNNLTISFRTTNGAVRAVRDISFSFNEGETLAIVGESGSGKSVTTRAIMGILAGNAMVDGGEIIYDGKDLLKIPEEEFHNLRGHRLAMVFQDPLSALNPIMRIGKQLTEAMLLNNKERRRDGRKSFNELLDKLRRTMKECGVSDVDKKIDEFDSFTKLAVKEEFAYKEATEAIVEAQDCLNELESAIEKRDDMDVPETISRLLRALKGIYNPYTVPQKTTEIEACIADFKQIRRTYRRLNYASRWPVTAQVTRFLFGWIGLAIDQSATAKKSQGTDKEKQKYSRNYNTVRAMLSAAVAKMKSICEAAAPQTEPNFFRIGYLLMKGQTPNPQAESIESINERARQQLDEGFMLGFLRDLEKTLRYSEEQSLKKKVLAIAEVEKAESVFSRATLIKSNCDAALKSSSAAVNASIDPLQLDKNSSIYVYSTSAKALIERYFRSFKQNPEEEKRFNREKAKYDAMAARGKVPPSPVPMNKIDTEDAHIRLVKTAANIETLLKDQVASGAQSDYSRRAVAMIDYLKASASDYAFKLSKGMARHRAIELMKEVGIPEPHKRYRQYPFEFSGGMRQRIVIAIALSANPDILICDEPTTALDVTIQAQILELINRLKRERRLSVIFITHDLGVVANMADKIAIMYAGKIVEYGTADEVFYDPRHPYTWALLSSMPDLETKEKLEAIPGTPPDMILPPQGDAFAARNKYAMRIDFEQQPPAFPITETHWAATWLLHPDAPKQEPPRIVTERIERMKKEQAAREAQNAEGGAQA